MIQQQQNLKHFALLYILPKKIPRGSRVTLYRVILCKKHKADATQNVFLDSAINLIPNTHMEALWATHLYAIARETTRICSSLLPWQLNSNSQFPLLYSLASLPIAMQQEWISSPFGQSRAGLRLTMQVQIKN